MSSELRASDGDREYAVAALQHHHEAGRLDTDELEARVAAVLAARTMGEIGAQFRDLPAERATFAPALPQVPAVPVRPPRIGGPGLLPFTYTATLPAGREQVAARFLQHVGPGLRAAGYAAEPPTASGLVFSRRRIPRWAWVAAFLVPGPGWIALFVAEREVVEVRVDLEELGRDDTRVTIHGVAPRSLRKALAQLVS